LWPREESLKIFVSSFQKAKYSCNNKKFNPLPKKHYKRLPLRATTSFSELDVENIKLRKVGSSPQDHGSGPHT